MKLIFIIFLISCFIQCFYYILFLSKLGFESKPKVNKEGQKGVSVIVCAKNEASVLQKNISHWLNQDYPLFELIVVNDNSTDETAQVLRKFESDKRFRQIFHEPQGLNRGKRGALEYGIKNSSYELLLLSDADCVPQSDQWVSKMVGAIGHKDIVLGIGNYLSIDNKLLSNLIQYETTLTYLQYLTAASIGMPYGGVGRNILYRKSIFLKGFPQTPAKLLSGDDDLWLKVLATKNNTNICISTQSITQSTPPDSWQKWFHQKRRHYSTGIYYRWTTKLYTSSFLSSKVLIYGLLVPLVVSSNLPEWVIVLPFLVTIGLILLATRQIQKNIEKRHQQTIIPFMDFFGIFLLVFVGIFATFSPPRKWK